jgi:RHS repeat-associated protein
LWENIALDTSGYKFSQKYALRDHLGNTRLTFSDANNDGTITQADIEQENHYYAFGLNMEGNWNGAAGPNKYQYNGKEWNDDFGLGWNLYEARPYDPATGRFTGIDLLADVYSTQTPYAYASNSPVTFIDFMGMGPDEDEKNKCKEFGNCGGNSGGAGNLGIYTLSQESVDRLRKEADEKSSTSSLGNNSATTENKPNDAAFCPPCIAFAGMVAKGAFAGAAVEYGFQVGENLYDGKGFESFRDVNGTEILKGAGIGALTSGLGFTTTKVLARVGAGVATKTSTKLYSEATFKAFERQLAKDGMKSILKTQSGIQKNLAEHIQKLAEIKKSGGYSSSVEREIKTFQSQLDALTDLLK